ncbi:MAG: YggT family protein [Halomonadaceae bacterium]|nr:MAG: YggT family protein [Halomonadaceae bacterium]
MLAQILVQSLQLLTMFYLTILILRFLLRLAEADFYNPITQFVVKATNPPVAPFQRMLPPWNNFDFATLLVAVLFQSLTYTLLLLLMGAMTDPLTLLAWGAVKVLSVVVTIYFFAVIAMIVISWIAPGNPHPGIQLIQQVTEPVMRPFRSVLPPMGGLDLSPILLFLVLNMLRVVVSHLEVAVGLPF